VTRESVSLQGAAGFIGGIAVNKIGLRKEEKAFEGRVPVVPEHMKQLTEKYGLRFVIEPSNQRAFSSEEYIKINAEIDSLESPDIRVILGIKEMPIDFFQKDKVYIFFSHTIKGQKQNMPILQKIIDVGATLLDYERVIDNNGRRIIFFGNWAGMAGISDTLRVLGDRLEYDEVTPNPFAEMKTTLECKTLETLKDEFRKLGRRIETTGFPESLTPFVVGFAGYGNVSRGAQEVFDLLPHIEMNPSQLENLKPDPHVIYKCVFKESDMVEPIDAEIDFDLQDYYNHGASKYKGIFNKYIPYLTVLMNCIYWTKKYPRLVTKEYIKKHWSEPNRRLIAIGDISCDVGGAIEFTVRCTSAGEPAFTYSIKDDQAILGVRGDGPIIMAVDNLPCELPRESSTSFSKTLVDFIPILANANYNLPFAELNLPRELKDAIIVYQGTLTENYQYLKKHLEEGQ